MGMSENEALKFMKLFRDEWDKNSKTKNAMALDVAIQALEEIQQYRVIGTVQEVAKLSNSWTSVNYKLRQFEKIGTIEEFKALKEKAEPKKPQEISWGATNCPICGQEFGFNSHFNHCSNCGQKLDWQ